MIFPCIEDYMEFIAGYINLSGKKIQWFSPTPAISLANYDVGFVTSVSEQIQAGTPMTDRQAVLAEKIITNYARQLRKLNVDQPDHKHYRLGQRTVDRSSSLTLHGDMLHLKFPFNERMIASVKDFMKFAQGRVVWSKDNKAWTFGLTEYNLSWVVAFAQSATIYIDQPVQELFDLILECEKTPFAIELRLKSDNTLYIANAPESLQEYVANNIGFDNIYSLVDSSGALGYTVSTEILAAMKVDHSDTFMKLCAGKSVDLTPSQNKYSMSEIIDWAVTVDRLPIVVFNPNFLAPDLTEYQQHFKDDEIQVVTLKDFPDGAIKVDPAIKIVYTNRVLNNWEGRLPLLITYANLMHSQQKKFFLGMAEKVIYYCDPLPKR
jgi:hypothetical protein